MLWSILEMYSKFFRLGKGWLTFHLKVMYRALGTDFKMYCIDNISWIPVKQKLENVLKNPNSSLIDFFQIALRIEGR